MHGKWAPGDGRNRVTALRSDAHASSQVNCLTSGLKIRWVSPCSLAPNQLKKSAAINVSLGDMKTILATLSLALVSVSPVRAEMFQPPATTGAVLGAITGAFVGGHNHNRWAEGAAIGAVAGALIGTAVTPPPPVYQAAPAYQAALVYESAQVYAPPPAAYASAPQVVYAPSPQVVYVQQAPQVVYVPAPPRVVYYSSPVVSFGYIYRSGPGYGYRAGPSNGPGYSSHGRGRR